MIGWWLLLLGAFVAMFGTIGYLMPICSPIIPMKTPCPYCENPDRADNGNVVAGGLSGNCGFNADWHSSYPPCITDHWWMSRYGEI